MKKNKHWRLWLVGAAVLLLIGFFYIQLSTAYISNDAIQQAVFRSLPKEEQEALGDRAWRYFKVEKVKLKDVPSIINSNFSQKINQRSLFLNGNVVYKVTFPLSNPMYGFNEGVAYVNPFTRGIVGYAGML
ncbi:hypothetical protein [Paenibacillus marinisediminis]